MQDGTVLSDLFLPFSLTMGLIGWGSVAMWFAAGLAIVALLAFGSFDLLYAVTQGTRFNQAPSMGAAYFIPAVAVPLLVVSHFLVFRRLRR